MNESPTIFVVDDDEASRESVCALIRSMGMDYKSFASAEELLDDYTVDQHGCIVTDLRLTGRTGVELQEELIARGFYIPIIVLTGFARTPVTVRAMRNGAVTMLDKPYHDDDLWQAIREALKIDTEQRVKRQKLDQIRARRESLTQSERLVLDLIVEGVPNKTIALRMDVSERTVENRRHEIFQKMQANSVAQLVRMVVEAEGSCCRRI